MADTKICRTCGIEKPYSQFYCQTLKSGSLSVKPDCRVCNANAKRERWLLNPSKYLEHLGTKKRHHTARAAEEKAYRTANAASIHAYQAKYRKENPDKVIESRRRFRAANPDRAAQHLRDGSIRYRAKHPDRVKLSAKRWRQNNPDKLLEKERKRMLRDPTRSVRYYAANQPAIRARRRSERLSNPGAAKERDRICRLANVPAARERDRRYRIKNTTRIRQRRREFAQKHSERLKLKGQLYRKTNPAKMVRYSSFRRAFIRGAGGTHTDADVINIRHMQTDKCAFCRCRLRGGGEVDHRVPISRGGSDNKRNLQILCAPCNREKWAHDEMEFMRSKQRLL